MNQMQFPNFFKGLVPEPPEPPKPEPPKPDPVPGDDEEEYDYYEDPTVDAMVNNYLATGSADIPVPKPEPVVRHVETVDQGLDRIVDAHLGGLQVAVANYLNQRGV